MAKQVSKTEHQLLASLEDYASLLAQSLAKLHEGDAAHIRSIAGLLRNLVCTSSSISGLLWRALEIAKVDDAFWLQYPGPVDVNGPFAKDLAFLCAPVDPDGTADNGLPAQECSFRWYIDNAEAAFVEGAVILHRELINRLASESGIPHESQGISKEIARLNAFLVGGVQWYFPILDSDSRLALRLANRIIEGAESSGYARRRPIAQEPPRKVVYHAVFNPGLDVPSIPPTNRDAGTIIVVVGIPEHRSAKMASSQHGSVTVHKEITARGRLRVSAHGLPIPNFGFEVAIQGKSSEVIGIAWNGLQIRGYVGGQQVCGPAPAPGPEEPPR